MRDLKPLYSPASALTHQGDAQRGVAAIVAKLESVVAMYTGFGGAKYVPGHVDFQPLSLVRAVACSAIKRIDVSSDCAAYLAKVRDVSNDFKL